MDVARSVRHWHTAQGTSCLEIASGPEAGHLHCHTSFSIGIVLEGAFLSERRDRSMVLSAGSVFASSPFQPHRSTWLDQRNRHFLMHIPADAWRIHARSMLAKGYLPTLKGPLIVDESLAGTLLHLMERLKSGTGGEITSAIERCVMRCSLLHTSDVADPMTDLAEDTLRGYLAGCITERSNQENVRIEAVAKEVGISRFKFSRLFHDQYGMQPRQFRKQVMVSKARSLILSGGSLASAAVESGFSDQSHMCREFRRTFGVTPGEFRTTARV